ncbi:plasmodesmata-located protein 3-like [Rhododendron vialii]|uniref:plasmodesmata-located protein 3-like n=1 Tax=Rhododendron vialii TaxID=182163 RepID=UPI00265EA03A|nr:plasmodesmata-located protein 3-like [Rhododendron vialii]
MYISSSKSCCYLLSLALLFFSCFANNLSISTDPNLHDLVYKHCASHISAIPTAGSLPEILSSLFRELVEQSSVSKFYETSVGDDDIAVSGLFQCRSDLGVDQCFDCVNRLPEMSSALCGRTVPARIRLSGCYLHYKADGSQISRLELQHKTCSDSKAASDGFEGVRDGAFAAVVSGVMGGNGFCDMSYESMHVTAQCQGNLESCDCGECVASAVQIAQDECGESISGEVYLDSCFMIYSYDGINEIPGNSNGGNGGTFGTRNIGSGKFVAIVGGGAVAVAFALFFFYFCKSSRRKSDDL